MQGVRTGLMLSAAHAPVKATQGLGACDCRRRRLGDRMGPARPREGSRSGHAGWSLRLHAREEAILEPGTIRMRPQPAAEE